MDKKDEKAPQLSRKITVSERKIYCKGNHEFREAFRRVCQRTHFGDFSDVKDALFSCDGRIYAPLAYSGEQGCSSSQSWKSPLSIIKDSY